MSRKLFNQSKRLPFIGFLSHKIWFSSYSLLSSNVISQMMFDQRFGYDSEEQRILVESVTEVVFMQVINSIARTLPFANLLPSIKKERHSMVNVNS